MGLLDLLQSLGGRLGILEMSQDKATSPAKIRTRIVTLAELMTEIRSEEVRALVELPAELSIPLEKVFEAAGIQPQAWTVDRLRQLLWSGAFKDQPRDVAQKLVLETLSSEKASAEDIIKDAIARDKVLDAFETHARKKMDERNAAVERRIGEIGENIRRLQGEMAELEARRKSDREKWAEWKKQKQECEKEMAWAVGYLIDRPVITIADE